MQASTYTHDEKSVNYRSVYVFMSAFNMTDIVVCACTDDTLHSYCSLHCVVTSSFLFQLLGTGSFWVSWVTRNKGGSVELPKQSVILVGQFGHQNWSMQFGSQIINTWWHSYFWCNWQPFQVSYQSFNEGYSEENSRKKKTIKTERADITYRM